MTTWISVIWLTRCHLTVCIFLQWTRKPAQRMSSPTLFCPSLAQLGTAALPVVLIFCIPLVLQSSSSLSQVLSLLLTRHLHTHAHGQPPMTEPRNICKFACKHHMLNANELLVIFSRFKCRLDLHLHLNATNVLIFSWTFLIMLMHNV